MIRIPGFLALALLLAVVVAAPRAERFGYSSDEFAERRARLAERLDDGTVLLFGATAATPGLRFRQDNDFFYLTGNESMNAALVMDAATGQSHLFLPAQTDTEVRYEGANWLREARGRGAPRLPVGPAADRTPRVSRASARRRRRRPALGAALGARHGQSWPGGRGTPGGPAAREPVLPSIRPRTPRASAPCATSIRTTHLTTSRPRSTRCA